MASLAELATANTPLSNAAISHLQRLVGSWALPCDPRACRPVAVRTGRLRRDLLRRAGHIRSSTGPTRTPVIPWAGSLQRRRGPWSSAVSSTACASRVRWRSRFPSKTLDTTVLEGQLERTDPQRHGRPCAGASRGRDHRVLTREGEAGLTRIHSGLEREYRELFQRFAVMVEEEPPARAAWRSSANSRACAGDGVMVLDRERRIEFASPNACRRCTDSACRPNSSAAASNRSESTTPWCVALETRLTRSPRSITATICSVAAVSSAARQDAPPGCSCSLETSVNCAVESGCWFPRTPRFEIHHRVKNNLQTIQSLLQLQSRRLNSSEAKNAVAQSARRIGSIAIVHETLATDATDEVDFDSVVACRGLFRKGSRHRIDLLRVEVSGGVGMLGEVAMPLAVALVELVQNVVDQPARERARVWRSRLPAITATSSSGSATTVSAFPTGSRSIETRAWALPSCGPSSSLISEGRSRSVRRHRGAAVRWWRSGAAATQ